MFGILVQSRFDYKKPQCILHLLTQVSYACFRPLLPFGSACSSFLLNVSTTRIHGWMGRGTGVSPREDNPVGLVELSFSNPARDIVSRFTPSPCKPAWFPGRLRSYIMKRLNDNSDLLKILRCAFETYNTLKSGYLESVYEAALEYELLQAGFSVSRQVRIPVFYKGVEMKKDFYADMIVNGRIILELKAVSSLNAAHERQLVSYMKSTGIREGMLLNFGNVRRLEWRVNSP